MFRTVLLAAAVSLASTVAASAGWVTNDLRLRSGPGTNHHARATLRACSQVDVRGHRGGWVLVVTSSGQGWVSARYVSGSRPHHCQPHRARVVHRPPPQVFFPVLPIERGYHPHYPRRHVQPTYPRQHWRGAQPPTGEHTRPSRRWGHQQYER